MYNGEIGFFQPFRRQMGAGGRVDLARHLDFVRRSLKQTSDGPKAVKIGAGTAEA